MLRADQRRRECDVEAEALCLKLATGRTRLLHAAWREVDIPPPGEKILAIPLALPVSHQDQQTIGHASLNPRTSIIEYTPGDFPRAHIAARSAPRAKIMRSSA